MAEELKQAIAGYYAATTTLQTKGTPSGDEGIDARKAMETRQEQSQRTRDNLITDILNEMQVYLAGGDSIGGTLLNQKIQDAATLVPRPALPAVPSGRLRRLAQGHRPGQEGRRRCPGRGRSQGRPGEPPGLQGDPRLRRQRQEGDRRSQAVRRGASTAGRRTPSTPP